MVYLDQIPQKFTYCVWFIYFVMYLVIYNISFFLSLSLFHGIYLLKSPDLIDYSFMVLR